ncbi:MAG: hypothetical protein ACKPGB_29120, partial [Dolichospermum sp.]
DGTISVGQVETAKHIEVVIIQQFRLKDPAQPLLAHELGEFRRAIGRMSWLSRQTQPDLAVNTSLAAQSTGDPRVKHVIYLNIAIAHAKDDAARQWVFHAGTGLSPENLEFFVAGDASLANVVVAEMGEQGQEWFQQEFSLDLHIQRLEKIYSQTITEFKHP